MRRLLLIVLVALLPLQWSVAAVHCLRAGHLVGDVQRGAAAGDRVAHDHATHDHAAHDHAAHDHAAHGHAAHGHAAHGHAAHDHSAHDHAAHGHDGSSGCPPGGCVACCHAAGSLPAAVHALSAPPGDSRADPERRAPPAPSPALDGPFRPPRSVPA
jgi:hypothetical protein